MATIRAPGRGCSFLSGRPNGSVSLSCEELAKDANICPNGSGFTAISLAYNARTHAEVNSVLDAAVAAGATLRKPAEGAFWGGYSGYFSDPDGFLWEIAWNPDFHISEDGSIGLPS